MEALTVLGTGILAYWHDQDWLDYELQTYRQLRQQ